jgi:hypothetical protein
MTDDLKIRKWTSSDKVILWGIVLLCTANFVIGLLTLGPDILDW